MKLAVLCVTVANVIGDLPPGTRRNTYLPPEPTKGGYTYKTPTVPFPTPTPTRPTFPGTRPTYPTGPTFPGTRPTYPPTRPTYPGTRPTYPPTRPTYPGTRPTFPGPEITGQPSGTNGNAIGIDHDHHHHEPGMPFDFNYAVKEDAYGNDYSHNAISDGEVVRGEYRIQLPDGRTQVVRYNADWQHGFSAQVTYEGNIRYDNVPRPGGNFRGY
ncbi:DNA-directed RNA polymerase II subunit RPB1 [Ooceraea biroi]|uniref:DNA-directed RNA polymerase II subunit RPB1 n=1 Tax=Ooceraea biroi TaxID=2015173 RepID=UPI000F0921E5|nr:DNA-directed RNA polymerase II subunit RPB1 [Ooceraea biroi]